MSHHGAKIKKGRRAEGKNGRREERNILKNMGFVVTK